MRPNITTGAILAGAILGVCPGALAQPTISTATDGHDKTPTITWTITVPEDSAISSIHIKGPFPAALVSTTEPVGWTWKGKVTPEDSASYDWQTDSNVSGTFKFSVKLAAHSPLEDRASIVQFDVLDQDDDGEWWRYYEDFSKPQDPNAGNWAFVPVPTPGTLALLGASGLAAAARRRRQGLGPRESRAVWIPKEGHGEA